jgi:CRP-like cAMP-binding protein
MADLRQLKDKAADLAAKGKLAKAAELYRAAVVADPADPGLRRRLAEVLRRAGRTAEAIEAYRAVADRLAREGLLVKAIAISKTILELDPDHDETQAALAELYAKRAAMDGTLRPRTSARRPSPANEDPPPDIEDPVVALPLGPGPGPEPASEDLPVEIDAEPELAAAARAEPPHVATDFARIVSAAHAASDAGVLDEPFLEPEALEIGVDVDAGELDASVEPTPSASAPLQEVLVAALGAEGRAPPLPRVPIFSDLSPDAFVALTRTMALRRIPEGDVVLREGDGGTSFYAIASGRLAVSKRDEQGDPVLLARLREGEFFGEMALLSGAPRAATVIAEEPSELLELSADVLLEIARKHPHVASSLRRFYRQRLLANAMAISPIFRPFTREERKLLVERFREREAKEGEVILRRGEPSDGLYVVLDGAVDVLARKAGREIPVANLRAGDLFGEMSCLRKAPASASVVVRRAGTLLRLPRRVFDEVVLTHPQILELVSDLSDERAENLDAILSGRAAWAGDGLVLV